MTGIQRFRAGATVVVAGLLLVGSAGCGVKAGTTPDVGTADRQPSPESSPSATPEEDPAVVAARACVVGSWLADNAALGAALFAQGAITSGHIGGTSRLIASAEGLTVTEFEGWSYEVLMPGPLGTPTIPMTVTRNAVEPGSYLVNPDGSITVTADVDPADSSAAASTPADPVHYRCEGDLLTQQLFGGTVAHQREG